jgi:hypothetical protein
MKRGAVAGGSLILVLYAPVGCFMYLLGSTGPSPSESSGLFAAVVGLFLSLLGAWVGSLVGWAVHRIRGRREYGKQ